jgi:hypothetical protein
MKATINLLPTAYRKQRMLRLRMVQWTTAVCLVLGAIWTARWYELREYYTLSQQLEAVAREGRPAQTMLTQITQMRQQLRQLAQQETVAQELQQQRHALALLGMVSEAAQRTNGKLRITKFEALGLQSSRADNPSKLNEPRFGAESLVTMLGVSLESSTVAELHDVAADSGLFHNVKLVKSNEREVNGLAVYDFEVQCDL